MSRREIKPSFHFCILLCLFLMLAGCASQQPLPGLDRSISWEAHKNNISRLNTWRLAGRISVRLEDDAWSASLYWQQDQDAYNLRIIAPLAGGSVEIDGDSDTVSLKTGEDEIYTERDVDMLMQDKLGWSIPISAMAYWVKGLPQPGVRVDKIKLDDTGRLIELSQSNWEVIYQSYTRAGGHSLPSRLQLSRAGIRVRFSINSWNLSDE
jgi:outer membrane lipoprotein LolB